MFNKLKNKNILFIIHNYNTFQKDQIEVLAKYFNKVYVLVRYKPIAELSKFLPISYLKLHTKKFVFQLENKPENVSVIPVPLFYFPTRSSYKKLGEKHLKKTIEIIDSQNIKFDIIHSHFTWSAGYVGSQLKKIYGKPFVLTTHRYDICQLPYINKSWKTRIKNVIKHADINITVSNKNLNYYKLLRIPTENIQVIANGFTSSLFFPKDKNKVRKKLNLPIKKKIIMIVANLEPQKGHKYLINSIKNLKKKYSDIHCIIIGDGTLKNTLQHQINSNNLKKEIVLCGAKKHNEIPDYINACDIFVLPSLSEGNPTVMFECLGCGKPYVGSNVGGVPEIITTEDYGLLYEKEKTHKLTETLIKAIEKDWDYGKIIEYSKQFEWANIGKEIIKNYEKIFIY
ncbi:MAG: glycosyltransferase [Desulfobacteraceae bacterium]|nr:glycosyltransferase [Desulfobacteraceae bacterium]